MLSENRTCDLDDLAPWRGGREMTDFKQGIAAQQGKLGTNVHTEVPPTHNCAVEDGALPQQEGPNP